MTSSNQPPKAGIVIVDDHPMVRERLAQLINKQTDIFVCGEANNIGDGFNVIRKSGALAAVVDISLKGSSGLELVKNLKSNGVEVPVLVLSMHDESLYAERALRSGAKGYITKQAESEEILDAIRQVLAGEVSLNPRMASKILSNLAANPGKSGMDRLTDRELEVFEWIGQGRSTREVGIKLGLSPATVETYRARIKEKLNLENASELSAAAARWVTQLADQPSSH
jgi:DNA-binding NarL/FixJ family response regulator